jgi:hypothetical protein
MNNHTIKNDPADRSDEANIELVKQLRSLWWSISDSNRWPLQCECSALAN